MEKKKFVWYKNNKRYTGFDTGKRVGKDKGYFINCKTNRKMLVHLSKVREYESYPGCDISCDELADILKDIDETTMEEARNFIENCINKFK